MLRKSDPTKKRILFLLCALPLLLLSGMVGTELYLRQLLGRIQYVDPAAKATLSQEQLDAYLSEKNPDISEVPPTAQPEDMVFPETEAQISESATLNILLIGQDQMEGESRTRSDTIILCTFHTEQKRLTMTSFLRDLYVQIPGYQSNRINAAYAAGGMALLNQTLETNFGVQIDGNIEVDFSGFTKIVDILGGVTLELRQDEADVINKGTSGNLTAGAQLLNGEQALAYARIRKLDADGDFSRTARQRKLLETVLQGCRNSSPATLLSLMYEVLPFITTDMPKETLLKLALELLPILPEIQVTGQQIPAEGTYSYKTIRGMSVLSADMESARQLLKDTLDSESS